MNLKRINKHNYEVFFLDYIEGKLDDSYLNEFEKFLDENPSLKEELQDFEIIKLKPEKIKFNKKDNLIKETQSKHFEISNFEYLCVGDLEDDLNEDEKLELQEILDSNSKYKGEYKQLKNTKLLPDLNISYPYKKQLERRDIPFYIKAGTSVAAAAVAIVLLLNQTGLNNNNRVNSTIGSAVALNSNIIKPIQIKVEKEKSNVKQEAFISHNQTVKQTNNNDLAFNDNEPHDKENLYKELTVSIPDLRSEALIYETNNIELANYNNKPNIQDTRRIRKEDLWKYAETSVSVWKRISSSEFEMKNKYNKDGSIDKLSLFASNFKFSRTFNKK